MMGSFRDQTFCGSDCIRSGCFRYFGEAEKAAAERWWKGPGAPVAYANFAQTCKEYVPPSENEAG